jgi:hypothetical protein
MHSGLSAAGPLQRADGGSVPTELDPTRNSASFFDLDDFTELESTRRRHASQVGGALYTTPSRYFTQSTHPSVPDWYRGAAPPTAKCPPNVQAVVNETGFVPVTMFGATPSGSGHDDDAVRAALDSGCGGVIFFPPGKYSFNNSVEVFTGESATVFLGRAGPGSTGEQFSLAGNAQVTCKNGPAFVVGTIFKTYGSRFTLILAY